MNKPKEQANADFIQMTRHSWTYQRMTEPEKAACEKALTSAPAQEIQGTYRQRWSAYNAIYHAFLIGIGYNGALWREPATGEPLPFVVGAEGGVNMPPLFSFRKKYTTLQNFSNSINPQRSTHGETHEKLFTRTFRPAILNVSRLHSEPCFPCLTGKARHTHQKSKRKEGITMSIERFAKLLDRKHRAMMDLYRLDTERGKEELADSELTFAVAYYEILMLLNEPDYFEEIYAIYLPAGD